MAPKTLMDFISESQHIMKAPSSLLHPHPPLLLPHLILSPTLFHLFNLHQRITANTNPSSLIVFLLLYSLFVSLFSTCGVIALLLWPASVDGWAWKDWAFVVQIVLTSTLLMLLMLYNAAADTVLYMYCKAVHGELALEIAEEFAWQYVCLPFDDGKVPHVVSVVRV
ncbi:hypothetical protein glysoja_007458 [Glycine soja]|nr:hypothetical protein glysoja_007458 [Glycine soja]